MFKKSVVRGWGFALLAVTALGLTRTADAQTTGVLSDDRGMDVRLFRPAMDSKGFISVNASDILGHQDYSIGLVLDAGLGIFPFDNFVWDDGTSIDGASGIGAAERSDRLIQAAITGTLQFNYGIENLAVVGVQLPLQAIVGPNTVIPGAYNDGSSRPQGIDSQGFGDLVLHGKYRILRREENPIGLAAILQVGLPTGNANQFRGEPGLSLWPIAVAEWRPDGGVFRFAVNGGYRLNTGSGAELRFDGTVNPVTDTNMSPLTGRGLGMCGPDRTGSITNATCPGPATGGSLIEYNDLITFGAAAGLRFAKSAELVAEIYGAQIAAAMGDEGSLGVEAIGGLKIFVEENSYLMFGGGLGVVQGMNSADYRGVISFIFEPSIGDRDGDGYKDDVDECPDEPEDFDRFEDEEGCPDPDNDRDGILDVDDECPLVPEDHDGDADEDGCPEGSIGDRDGDGILDNVDACPDDPEDRDNFEDEDGCPDPDNDRDGILDGDDLCPNDPEDKDNFEDEDGCPDLDNDHDRILDTDDACPNDPETYNGFEDADGCPDRGSVVIEENQLIILDKIYFATDSAEILSKSFPIVDAVASTLIGNPQITLIEIQGHADERGADDYNIRLTSDRAASVRQALAQRGVDMGRLRSAGYGERCPIDDQSNAEAWEANRRVEFKIIRTDMGETGVEVACPAGASLIPR